MYDFDGRLDRVPFNSIKWSYPGYCHKDATADALPLPLWVADMDFAVAPGVSQAILDRAAHPVYGYAGQPEGFWASFEAWMARRFSIEVERRSLRFSPGIVTGLALAVRAFTKEGDGIIIQPPVYHPFRQVIERNGRRMVENPLILGEDGRWSMDLAGLEAIATREKPRALILCSPHNPVGRVWSEEELSGLVATCARHGIVLIADEIHADIVYAPHRHRSALEWGSALGGRLAAFYAPSKTFNIAGLHTSYVVIPDRGLAEAFSAEAESLGLTNANVFGAAAAEAAYTTGEAWLGELLAYLSANAAFLETELGRRMPAIGMRRPEGTFLAFLDCRRLGLKGDVQEALARKAGIWLDGGAKFGRGGEGWARLNFGCPRANLVLALDRLEAAIKEGSLR
jgi:cystathionine beta-lyase